MNTLTKHLTNINLLLMFYQTTESQNSYKNDKKEHRRHFLDKEESHHKMREESAKEEKEINERLNLSMKAKIKNYGIGALFFLMPFATIGYLSTGQQQATPAEIKLHGTPKDTQLVDYNINTKNTITDIFLDTTTAQKTINGDTITYFDALRYKSINTKDFEPTIDGKFKYKCSLVNEGLTRDSSYFEDIRTGSIKLLMIKPEVNKFADNSSTYNSYF